MRCEKCQRPERRCECPRPPPALLAGSEDQRRAWSEGYAAAALYVQRTLLGGARKGPPVNPYGDTRQVGREAYDRWVGAAPEVFDFPAWESLSDEQRLVWEQAAQVRA